MGIESAIALIMAGGRGERMRASGTTTPKPLVELEGVPLLERNLTMLIRAGFQDIYVSVSSSSPDVGDFVSSRGVALGQGRARVQCLVESEPLGNIGSAAELRDAGRPVVVLFADNLITLDLESLLERHTQSRAA